MRVPFIAILVFTLQFFSPQILDMGEITNEIVIAICVLIIIAAMLHYHVKGGFVCLINFVSVILVFEVELLFKITHICFT